MEERLQKILAKAGICSRRKAEEYISQGRVSVDGSVITEQGRKFDASRHTITFNGRNISAAEKKVYILLNKPKGYVTTMNDPQGRPIVTSLIKDIKGRLFPVGRLDLDTEGALLLTNDGELSQRILHPSNEVKKTYEATVRGKLTSQDIFLLENGVEVDGRKTWPAHLEIQGARAGNTTVRITIHEGRKRQVRKMFDAVGHPVYSLKRLSYGGLKLGNLKPGTYRILGPRDLANIFSGKNTLYKK